MRGGLGLLGYHGTVRALEQHAQQLRMSSGEMPRPTFSLLLIERCCGRVSYQRAAMRDRRSMCPVHKPETWW
jgi:hypothetical protein